MKKWIKNKWVDLIMLIFILVLIGIVLNFNLSWFIITTAGFIEYLATFCIATKYNLSYSKFKTIYSLFIIISGVITLGQVK
jgi:hypothetical protein